MDVAGVSIDLAAAAKAHKVVLVEGGSDKAAVEVLAVRRGQVLGGAGLHVVAMGGATSIGHFLAVLGKSQYARLLAAALDPAQIPRPMDRMLAHA